MNLVILYIGTFLKETIDGKFIYAHIMQHATVLSIMTLLRKEK
jgi:hypothetical protein